MCHWTQGELAPLLNLHFPHVRHGCYLKRGPCAFSGTPKMTMKELGALDKSTRKRSEKCLKWSRRGATAAGHPAGARTSGATKQRRTRREQASGDSTAAGHPADPRTSGARRRAGHPAPPRKSNARSPEPCQIQATHGRTSGHGPDIWRLLNGRTSGVQPGHPAPTRSHGPKGLVTSLSHPHFI